MRAQDVAEFGIGAAEVYAMSIQCMEVRYQSMVCKRQNFACRIFQSFMLAVLSVQRR